ncbi:MAG: hypothetical protein MZU95_17645 [Desulfomicrobium escambiense]|nr:hypothetical protein [Desulfomicrobium escambiense]
MSVSSRTFAAPSCRDTLRRRGSSLACPDYDFIYDAVRLIAFELGLRFFTDHLEETSASRSGTGDRISPGPSCSSG